MVDLENILGLDNVNANVNTSVSLDRESLALIFLIGIALIISNIVLNKLLKNV